jgi:hypothetical protein
MKGLLGKAYVVFGQAWQASLDATAVPRANPSKKMIGRTSIRRTAVEPTSGRETRKQYDRRDMRATGGNVVTRLAGRNGGYNSS